ncbi:MAG: hypothetical protein O7D30_07805 [Rickettsia endosymbiont of Ixodes persulcatus]|nr:hypothetical protein [Rickettsia endosymbiont of Ixodes persulcatus]MCZ6925205.1 hypothetical protein [Rickettsia endosymbiont of Ixodes persulcatus]
MLTNCVKLAALALVLKKLLANKHVDVKKAKAYFFELKLCEFIRTSISYYFLKNEGSYIIYINLCKILITNFY